MMLPGCASEDAASEHECRTLQFEACDAGCGRGVRSCGDAGRWGACECAVVDAGFADRVSDGPSSDAADAGNDG